uniref:Sulfotransferase n=1 Tax=Branchiostoma floridae TaxID=7739 RepID=C3YPE1_BRAFL|eukprot:XP_002601713.1 hypothetical protein BRAFLDRAFT_76069 [Branchiostoma floridae]
MVSYRVFLVAVVVLTALTCVVQAVEGETKKKKEREKGKERGEKNRKDRNRRVRRLERRVAGIEGELLQHVTALRAGIGEQKERMQEVEALLNLHGDDVSSLRETLVKLQQVHDQIWRSLATLEKGAQDQTNVANERWEAHHRQTARVDSYLEGLETKQEEFVSLFQARCDAQDKRLDGLDVYIREAGGGGGGSDGESGDLYARLVMLEAAIDGLIVQFHQHVQDGPEGARSTGVTSSTGGNVVTNAQVEGAVAVVWGSWYQHVLDVWANRQKHNILIVRYEDMKKDLPAAIKQIAAFLGRQLTEPGVQLIASHCSFDSMKSNPMTNGSKVPMVFNNDKSHFLRKGVVGDWINHFTVAQDRAFDSHYLRTVAVRGMEFQFELL